MADTFDAPQSRNEAILQNMLGANNTLPAPQSRIEELLQEILEQGGGGGGGLPVVTQQDDGKVLKVTNGQWMAGSNAPLVEISYANLVELRRTGKLIAGTQYRITDYETIITGSYNLSALGAEGYIHYARSTEESWFDIIVTADDESHLNENARAARSDGADYAPDAKPEAWELKYTIDNDTTRFAWADAQHGKGVIYFMRDEHNNSAGYDFKSIQFLRYALKLADATADYTPVDTGLVYDASTQPNRYGSPYKIFTALQSYMQTGTYVNPFPMNHKGQTAYNYDFSVGYNILGTIQFPEADDTYCATFGADWYYTFDYFKDGEHYDISSVGFAGINTKCLNNTLLPDFDALASVLDGSSTLRGLGGTCFENNYVFDTGHAGSCFDNYIDLHSPFNTFGSINHYNQFRNFCGDNIFGNECYGNTLQMRCTGNTFGDLCWYNTAADYFTDNTLLGGNTRNTFASECKNNTFGTNQSGVDVDRGVSNIDTTSLTANKRVQKLINYNGVTNGATFVQETAYNTETAVSTTDGGATWA